MMELDTGWQATCNSNRSIGPFMIDEIMCKPSLRAFIRRFLYKFSKNLSVFQEVLYKVWKTVVLQDHFHHQLCFFPVRISNATL